MDTCMRDYHESVTTGQTDRQTDGCVRTDGRTDRQTPDKVIAMCRYASQATHKQGFNQYIICFNFIPFKCYIHITNIYSLSTVHE